MVKRKPRNLQGVETIPALAASTKMTEGIMKTEQELKYIYVNGNKFCATDEQHDYIHGYDPNSRLGDFYDCRYCDDFQVG